ncbi:MAG: DUF4185 domain-containing protein [Woeseia sp.]
MLKNSYVIFLIFSFAWLVAGCKNDSPPQSETPAETGANSGADVGTGDEVDDGGADDGGESESDPPDPVADSDTAQVITGVRFDFKTLKRAAPGSDNWALTWADDDSQYAAWGDGGGFGGTNALARVSLGLARIVGDFDHFETSNVWGGKSSLAKATFAGKSYGVLAVAPDLWLWRTGNASNESAFEMQDLFVSRDNGRTFEPTGVRFDSTDFPSSRGFFAPTFLQFGPGYRGAPDNYVYVYAPENKTGKWEVQFPGEIALMRVPMDQLANRDAYEFFNGLDSRGTPTWTSDIGDRAPVFSDPEDGVMLTSVTYNAGLDRYLLITQQRTHKRGGYIGIYEGPAPWGPWHTVLFEDAWNVGLQKGEKSVYWNFSNKWTSADGTDSALVYTGPGPDNFGAVMAEFETIYD